jgi:hypothetical protein
MHSRTIAACVAAVVLSSGLVSRLGAQKPSKPDTTKGGLIGPGGRLELDELTKTVEALRKRVSALESELAKIDKSDNSSPKMAAKFQAPFTVVDENGKMIFTVSDDQYSAAFRGRVHIGPGSGGNYNMWFHNASGAMMATMGESKSGTGLVAILKGGQEIGSMDAEGFITRNSSGKMIGHLGPDPVNTSRGRLVLRGPLSLTDESGNTVVDAGAVQNVLGVVRAWPNAQCRAGALATCLKGVP